MSIPARSGILATAILIGLGSCAQHDGGASPRLPAHSPYVLLTAASDGSWSLFGWTQEHHQLCLEVTPAGRQPAELAAAESGVIGGGACGFDAKPSGGYYMSTPGPAGSTISFGPLPTRATRIRLARNEVIATAVFPSGRGLPAGRYWFVVEARGWPAPTDGAALSTPAPLATNGQDVQFQNF